MLDDYRNIHIGKLIKQRMQECEVDAERAARFLDVGEDEIEPMFENKNIESSLLLRWSKLLQYDFFRIYSQHLILYSPQDPNKVNRKPKDSMLPVFKKNIYTYEVIMYLIGLVSEGKKTYNQLQKEYNIPATTMARWTKKYGTVN